MHDVLIIGGGVIGLSLAWDLAKHGLTVQVIDQSEPGLEASWAGAGILPAANRLASQHPYEQLRGLACQLHPPWSVELNAATGIDNGYRRCGGLHLARTPGEAAALAGWAALAREEGVEVVRLSVADLGEIEPGIGSRESGAGGRDPGTGGSGKKRVRGTDSVLSTKQSPAAVACTFLIPDEAQLRNPWHLQALISACQRSGVT